MGERGGRAQKSSPSFLQRLRCFSRMMAIRRCATENNFAVNNIVLRATAVMLALCTHALARQILHVAALGTPTTCSPESVLHERWTVPGGVSSTFCVRCLTAKSSDQPFSSIGRQERLACQNDRTCSRSFALGSNQSTPTDEPQVCHTDNLVLYLLLELAALLLRQPAMINVRVQHAIHHSSPVLVVQLRVGLVAAAEVLR